jgi:hypothetical protein
VPEELTNEAIGDLGVRRGWETIYKLTEKLTPAELEKKRKVPALQKCGWLVLLAGLVIEANNYHLI